MPYLKRKASGGIPKYRVWTRMWLSSVHDHESPWRLSGRYVSQAKAQAYVDKVKGSAIISRTYITGPGDNVLPA